MTGLSHYIKVTLSTTLLAPQERGGW